MKVSACLFSCLLSVSSCNNKVPTPATPLINSAALPGSEITQALPVSPVDPTIPACIAKKIDSIKQMPVWNPPAEIYEYLYNGSKVYLMSANCCDFFSTAVDSNCNYICAPAGGFTGRGDGKCTDFFNQAKQLRLVWKDERKRK